MQEKRFDEILICGRPVCWSAPNRKGNLFFSRHTPFRGSVQWQMKQQFQKDPYTCPLSLILTFYFTPPKNTAKKKLPFYYSKEIYYSKKKDLTNLCKFIEDCGNGILWKDDALIVRCLAEKRYSDKDETILKIYPIKEKNL